MSIFSKILESLSKTISKELDKNASKEASKNLAKPSVKGDIITPKNTQGNTAVKNPQNKINIAKQKLAKIDTSILTQEQQEVLKVFKGQIPSTSIQGKDLNDIYTLERGSRQQGARKILIRHYGVEKTGGLTNDELLNMGEIIKNGKILDDSFEKKADFVRYGYEVEKEGVKLRLVVDEYNDGKKIFDLYSDRNLRGNKPSLPNPDDKIIQQNATKKQDFTQNLPFTRE